MMPFEKVAAECKEIIRKKRYGKHLFVGEVAKAVPSKAGLGKWAVQKYHQVYLQNKIFSIIHSKTDYEDVRQFMMEQLVAEETAINCGSDTHYNLMKRFALACGVSEEHFSKSGVSAEVSNYLETLVYTVRSEHFSVGLLAIYAIEMQSAESVSKMMSSLREAYAFSDHDLEWFTVHGDADDDHAEHGYELVKKYYKLAPDWEVRAVTSVTRICDAWLNLHDYYHTLLQEKSSELA